MLAPENMIDTSARASMDVRLLDRDVPSTPAAPRISVVIPALNEARNLPYVYANLPKDIYQVVLVDGHSTNDTVAEARSLYPDVRVIRQTRRGKGDALACGFAACHSDIVAMIDADGSADGAEIPRLVAALQRSADFASGSRVKRGAGSADLTLRCRLGNRGIILVVVTDSEQTA